MQQKSVRGGIRHAHRVNRSGTRAVAAASVFKRSSTWPLLASHFASLLGAAAAAATEMLALWTTWCLLLLTSSLAVGDPTGEPSTRSDVVSGTCRFGDYEYNVGSTWNPRLETQGVVFCVTCRCFPGTGLSGRMNCTSQECPVRCNGDPSTDLCCRICKETQSSGGGGSSRKSPPPSATAPGGGGPRMLPPPGAAPAEGPSCLHGGRQYREGQRFSSNLTILRPTGPEQCVQCQCQAGVVMCDVISCERPTCRQPVTTPDNCCPQCPAIAPTSQASSGPAVLNPASSEYQNLLPVYFGNPETSVKNKRGKSCLSGGRQYMEGEAWHPVIGPLGPMLCVLCQCRSSRIECSRFRCPEPSQMPCAKPERPPGQCCEMCPSPTPAHTLALQPPQPIPHLRGTHQSSYIASAAADSSPQQSPSSPSLCLPPGADLLTYRARGPVLAPSTNNETELLQYAFSQQPPGDVELHAWRLARGAIVSFQTRHVAAQDFRHLVLQFRFTPLGATTSKHVVKFGRREKKLRHRCQVNCGAKLERLQQTLQLRPVAERSACLPGETTL